MKLRVAIPVFLVGLFIVAGPFWINVLRPQQYQVLPPPIPGATLEEQNGDIVNRGFALGRLYRYTLMQAHGDSWSEAASYLETEDPKWEDVKTKWAGDDRMWRDEPFDHVIEPEVKRILGPGKPSADRKRNASLFLRAFSAGLKDRR